MGHYSDAASECEKAQRRKLYDHCLESRRKQPRIPIKLSRTELFKLSRVVDVYLEQLKSLRREAQRITGDSTSFEADKNIMLHLRTFFEGAREFGEEE